MRNIATTRTLALVLLCCVFIGLTGCGDKQLVKQIDSFQTSVEKTATAVSIYYIEINSFERELYLDERLYNVTKRLSETKENGKPSALAGQTFSAESIKARTDAIAMLGKYGGELSKLAGNDSPERFATASQVLGENIGKLGVTFNELQNDSSSKSYSKPLGALGRIVGEIGRLVMESKRDRALRKAIDEAAPQVNTIISLLETDLTEFIKPLQETGTQAQLALRINDYNNRKDAMSFEERRAALQEVLRVQKRYEIALAFNPSGILGSLKKAHNSLVDYANSPRKIANLTQLIANLEEFHERADTILKAVITLRELRGGINA